MRIGFVGGITNITEIPNRSHSDLQNLTADDHKQYSHLIGLDADKPTTGNVVGRLYFATDTQKLYRWDGTSWVYVKTLASFLDLLDTPSSYSNAGDYVLKVDPTGNSIIFEKMPQSILYTPTDTDILFAHDDLATTVSTTYVKLKEIVLGNNWPTTTLRIQFTIHSIYYSENKYARIYKNDTPYGTERSIYSANTSATYTENLSFSAGDKIQLYAHTSSGGNNGPVGVSNFRILGIEKSRFFKVSITL